MKKSNIPEVLCLGSGEAFEAKLGNTSALVRLPQNSHTMETCILFDCGYQTAERLFKLHDSKKIDLSDIDYIAITHLHADHCFGIVPLMGVYRDTCRTTPLTIIVPRGGEKHLTRLIRLGYPNLLKRIQFSIKWQEAKEGKKLHYQTPITKKELQFSFTPTIHSIQNFSIRLDITNSPSISPLNSKNGKTFSFAISGDGVLTKKHEAFYQNVGLLFQEAYVLNKLHPVHPNLKDVLKIISKSDVQLTCLTHCSKKDRNKITRAVSKKTKIIMATPLRFYSLCQKK